MAIYYPRTHGAPIGKGRRGKKAHVNLSVEQRKEVALTNAARDGRNFSQFHSMQPDLSRVFNVQPQPSSKSSYTLHSLRPLCGRTMVLSIAKSSFVCSSHQSLLKEDPYPISDLVCHAPQGSVWMKGKTTTQVFPVRLQPHRLNLGTW